MSGATRKRAEEARDFPTNTCGASRHLFNVAVSIEDVDGWCICTHEDPEHVAHSMFSTLASLWETRADLKSARSEARKEAFAEVDLYFQLLASRVLRPDDPATLHKLIAALRREIAEMGEK